MRKKTRKQDKRIKRLLYAVAISAVVWALFIVLHEYTHGTIYQYFGCENVSYGYTRTVFYANCTDEGFYCSEACNVAHSNNEVVGYTVMPFVLMGLCVLMAMSRRLGKA